jgi:putative thioredoxin
MSENESSQFIQDVDDKNFDDLVLMNSDKGPVLVNYWSKKVGPCIRQYPVLEKLAGEFAGRFLLVNLNTDEHRQLAKEYGVTSLPTMKLFHKGVVVETLHGYQDEADMKRVMARFMPRASDKRLTEAFQIYQQGDSEKALVMMAEATMEDPQNIRLPLTMARLLVSEGRPAEAMNLLGSMPLEQRDDLEARTLRGQIGFILEVGDDPDPEQWRAAIEADNDDCEARYRLAALHALQDEYGPAMQGFYEILQIDRQFRDGAARQALITLFSILGDEHELVVDYRQRMQQGLH